MPYPYFNGWCGDIDLIGEKKPQSYYRDVVWGRSPITMAVELPCPQGYHREISGWGWQPEVNAWEAPETFFTRHNLPNILYNETEPAFLLNDTQISDLTRALSHTVSVNVYSKAKMVRLYLNDRLIGTKATSDTYHAGFEVDYEPGVLRAVEWDGEKEGAAFELKTCGKAAALRLKTDSYDSLTYITCELVDAEGNVLHDYEGKVSFSISDTGKGGSGKMAILAAGNANPTDMESFRTLSPRFYDGRAMAVVSGHGGILTVKSGKLGIKKEI